jgi:hypothetical protein
VSAHHRGIFETVVVSVSVRGKKALELSHEKASDLFVSSGVDENESLARGNIPYFEVEPADVFEAWIDLDGDLRQTVGYQSIAADPTRVLRHANVNRRDEQQSEGCDRFH